MTITAADVLAETWYTPESEQDQPSPTRFLLRGLSPIEYMGVAAELKLVGKQLIPTKAGVSQILDYGLVGWENLKDSQGKDVRFTGRIEVDAIRLDGALISELLGEILNRSNLSKGQEKN